MKVLLVTSKFRRQEELAKLLPNDTVEACFRDYQLEKMIELATPDLIVTDGTCKTRNESIDPGGSFGIHFDPRPVARSNQILVESWFWCTLKARVRQIFNRRRVVA